FADDAELRFERAGLLHRLGRHAEAVQTYLALLESPGQDYMISRNRGITGFLTRQNLAVVYGEMGDLPRAEEQWRLVVGEQPAYEIGWKGLWEVLMRQNKHQQALALSDDLL